MKSNATLFLENLKDWGKLDESYQQLQVAPEQACRSLDKLRPPESDTGELLVEAVRQFYKSERQFIHDEFGQFVSIARQNELPAADRRSRIDTLIDQVAEKEELFARKINLLQG